MEVLDVFRELQLASSPKKKRASLQAFLNRRTE